MTTSWRSSILSLLLLLVVAVNRYTAAECNLQVEECPTMVKGLEIESLMIPGCCEWPCKLLKNTTASIIIDFRTDVNYSMVEQKMCMEIGGMCIPTFKELPTNVCDLISCPLQAGKSYQITEKIAIPNDYPDILAIAKLLFYVDDGELENIGCLEMDIHFVS